MIAGCALLLLAALLASRALGFRRLAPSLAASFAIGNAVILAPIHVLGLTRSLTKPAVVLITLLTAALVGLGALSVLARRGLGHELRALVFMPVAAVRSVKGGPAGLALLLVVGVLIHALQGAVRLPSDSWDGIWYHDTIVGGTLQSGGYGPIPLPMGLLQQANGFPRNGEMAGLWLVSLADRSVIELPNACALVGLVASAHVVMVRFACDRWGRDLGLALVCVAVLVPGAILQLRSTYVDVYAAAAGLTAIAFLTAAPFRAREALVAGLALAVFAGTKSSALLVVPLGVLVLVARAFSGGAPLGLTAGAGVALTALSLATVYLRNALLFANPLYPFAIQLPRLGLALPGVTTEIDVNATAGELLRAVFLPTPPGRDFADIRRGGFGLAFAWLVLPLALAGIALAARALGRRAKGRRVGIERKRARWLLSTMALVAPAVAFSPALWSARYHLIAIAMAAAPATYALSRLPRLPRRGAPWLLFAAIAWIPIAILRFEPALGSRSDWGMDDTMAAQRERELGPGTTVAFGPGVAFPSQLYNDRFDNRLAFVAEDAPRAIDKALTAATWVVAAPDEPLYRFVGERPHQWELIGPASHNAPTFAFRRRPAP